MFLLQKDWPVVGCFCFLVFFVWGWVEAPGAWAQPFERGLVMILVGSVGALLSFGLRIKGLQATSQIAVPVLVLIGLSALPTNGKIYIEINEWVLFIFLIIIGLICWILKTKPRFGSVVLVGGLLGGVYHMRFPKKSLDNPPIVLLTLDTIRADFLPGFGGSQQALMPELAEKLRACRVYRNAFAPIALTGPSHTTMLSGKNVIEHGVRANGVVLPKDLSWVPKKLQDAGWHTRAVVSAAVLEASLGFSKGFDHFDSAFEDRPSRLWSFARFLGYRLRAGSSTHRTGQVSLSMMKNFPSGSFSWIHLYDAHWPYTPSLEAAEAVGLVDNMPLPESGVGRMLRPGGTWDIETVMRGKKLYQAELADLDVLLGKLFRKLPQGTALVIAGDHGESLDEHEYVFSHGKLPFSPDTHTILAACSPKVTPDEIIEPVGLDMVASILLSFAGLEDDPTPYGPVLSVSFAAGFLSNQEPEHPLGQFAGVAIREYDRTLAWTRWTDPARYVRSLDAYEVMPLSITETQLKQLTEITAVSAVEDNNEELKVALESLGYISPESN